MAEIAGAEPAVAEGFGIGVGVVVITGEDGGTDDADLAGFSRLHLFACVVLDLHLHACPVEPAGADPRFRTVFCAMEGRGSTVILPVTSPRPKYCTSTGPSFANARFWSARYIGAPA